MRVLNPRSGFHGLHGTLQGDGEERGEAMLRVRLGECGAAESFAGRVVSFYPHELVAEEGVGGGR